MDLVASVIDQVGHDQDADEEDGEGQEQRLLAHELQRVSEGARFDLRGVRDILARDLRYRRYMLAMSTFGAGNLMVTPLMVVCLDDVLHASELVQVAVTAALPILVMPMALQPWAAFLDRHHVVVYRSVHAWIADRFAGTEAPSNCSAAE